MHVHGWVLPETCINLAPHVFVLTPNPSINHYIRKIGPSWDTCHLPNPFYFPQKLFYLLDFLLFMLVKDSYFENSGPSTSFILKLSSSISCIERYFLLEQTIFIETLSFYVVLEVYHVIKVYIDFILNNLPDHQTSDLVVTKQWPKQVRFWEESSNWWPCLFP